MNIRMPSEEEIHDFLIHILYGDQKTTQRKNNGDKPRQARDDRNEHDGASDK